MVAVPTPRWYMLCARAADPAATSAIFRAKQRPTAKPLLLLLDSPATAETLFDLSAGARLLTGGLWPGDLALRLPWKPEVEPVAPVGSPALVGCPDGIWASSSPWPANRWPPPCAASPPPPPAKRTTRRSPPARSPSSSGP
jgi:tRNA A37 threonylcarbamoyladenosine synthetase subunit TsaC/SUA5/YrdC